MKRLLLAGTIIFPLLLSAQTVCDTAAIFANDSTNAVCFDTSGPVRYAWANSIPEHGDDYNQPQFEVEAQYEEYFMCAYPDTAAVNTPLYETTETTAGCTFIYAFGIAINGIQFDPSSGDYFVDSSGANNINWHLEATSPQNNIGQNMGNLNGGHLNPFGEYHYHGAATNYFMNDLGNDSTRHSSIVGYAADGFPIYYRYVYQNANDTNSAIIGLNSGYSLKSGQRPGDGFTAPDGLYDGNYVEDYAYTSSELDSCNGRWGKTPDYPYGTYYYVITENFPYIPRCFKGEFPDNSFRIGPGPACPASTADVDCAPAVPGCLDPFATNYNPNANVDDGSCQYAVAVDEPMPGSFDLYPNPAEGTFSVRPLVPGEYRMTLVNAVGAEVYSADFSGEQMQVNLSELSAGVYIVRLQNADNDLRQRLVIQ